MSRLSSGSSPKFFNVVDKAAKGERMSWATCAATCSGIGAGGLGAAAATASTGPWPDVSGPEVAPVSCNALSRRRLPIELVSPCAPATVSEHAPVWIADPARRRLTARDSNTAGRLVFARAKEENPFPLPKTWCDTDSIAARPCRAGSHPPARPSAQGADHGVAVLLRLLDEDVRVLDVADVRGPVCGCVGCRHGVTPSIRVQTGRDGAVSGGSVLLEKIKRSRCLTGCVHPVIEHD